MASTFWSGRRLHKRKPDGRERTEPVPAVDARSFLLPLNKPLAAAAVDDPSTRPIRSKKPRLDNDETKTVSPKDPIVAPPPPPPLATTTHVAEHTLDSLFSSAVARQIVSDARQLANTYRAEKKEDIAMRVGVSATEAVRSRMAQKKRQVRGDLLYKQFMGNFMLFKMYRYGPQMEFIRAAAAALIPQMFGDDFDIHRERISREYGITNFQPTILLTMPRRRGKTEGAAAVEASALYTFGGESSIFAAVFRQASDMLQLVYMRICELPGGKERVVRKSVGKIECSVTKSRTDITGRCRAYAGTVNSARGVKTTRVWADEASFLNPKFIISNVFANMLMKNCTVILLSSPPTDTNNIFHQMCIAKDTSGNPVFKWIRVDAMCEDCHNKKALQCPHKTLPTPPWISGTEAQDTVREIMGKVAPRDYRIEILGLAESGDVNAFDQDLIDGFLKQPRYHFKAPPDFIFISVDPSGGGSSDTGLMATAIDAEGRTVVSNTSALLY